MATSSVSDTIRLLVGRESLTEVRALFRSSSGDDSRICRNNFYLGSQCDQVAIDVHTIDNKKECIGIYLVSNPIDPSLISRNDGVWRKPFSTKVKSSKSSDMVSRRWVLVDCDSSRESDSSATEFERSKAFRLADDVVAALGVFGFCDPVRADSGNGCHLLYPVDMPSDQANNHIVRDFLKELSSRVTSSGAQVDPVTWDSQRMVRLYGTRARKGSSTPDRPWRTTGILNPGNTTDEARLKNVAAITVAMSCWVSHSSLLSGQSVRTAVDVARSYLGKVEPAVSGSSGHARTYRAAITLVEGFGLSSEEAKGVLQEWNLRCTPPWSDHDLEHKISSAIAKANPSRLGHLLKRPDSIAKVSVGATEQRADATVADLIRLGQSMQWIWPGWIQRGVLIGLAAEPGAGKTRLCADLVKRINLAMPWPDGTPPTLDRGSTVMWVACDGQWGEITQFPAEFGFAPESIFLNAWNDNPTEGTMLDQPDQFKQLEERIIRTGVSLVFLDTVMNSTTHNTMRPEDGVKFFKPLAEVAQKTNTTIVLVTHLSVGGEALGRRIVGQCRQMISLEKIEGEAPNSNSRKIFVSKSNSIMPPEIMLSMGDNGNTYSGEKQQEPTMNPLWWTGSYLGTGKKPESFAIRDAERSGYSLDAIKDAFDRLSKRSPSSGKYIWLETK